MLDRTRREVAKTTTNTARVEYARDVIHEPVRVVVGSSRVNDLLRQFVEPFQNIVLLQATVYHHVQPVDDVLDLPLEPAFWVDIE